MGNLPGSDFVGAVREPPAFFHDPGLRFAILWCIITVSDASNLPNRQSIRLRGRDYSQGGIYFVTLCTQDRRYLFGEIAGETMQLNVSGEIVRDSWKRLEQQYGHVELGEFIVMPNHHARPPEDTP